MHHRAISEYGQRLALTHRRCLAEFDAVIILGHRARIMLRPRLDRTVVIAAERAVVDALGLEEYDGVIVLDRRDQQPLGVIGVRRDHRLHAADMSHDTFGRLAVRLATEAATAARRAHQNGRAASWGRGDTDW